MASSSSLAHFNADARENAFETIEIDPQYAQGLGFAEGDIVRLLLLREKLSHLVSGRSRLVCCMISPLPPQWERNLSPQMTGKLS